MIFINIIDNILLNFHATVLPIIITLTITYSLHIHCIRLYIIIIHNCTLINEKVSNFSYIYIANIFVFQLVCEKLHIS